MTKDPARQGTRGLQLKDAEGFLWVGILVSCLATMLLVKGGSREAVALMEPQGRLWWGWFLAFHLAIALGSGILLTGIAAAVHRPKLSRIGLQVISAGVLLVSLALNRGSIVRLLTGAAVPEISWIGVGALVLALVGLGAVATGLLWVRPYAVRGVSVAAVVTCFVALPGSFSEDAGVDSSIPSAVSSTGERLLVIGLDGADWDYMNQLIARGELPNLLSLREAGAWGELATLRPTRSARIWTSVVTGVEPRRHGVTDNSVERLRGSYHRLPEPLPLPRGLGASCLESLLRHWGYLSPSTVASFDRKVPAFWTIATHNDSPVDFVNWWASWPAEQIRGSIVSDRTHFWRAEAKGFSVDQGYATYPDSLLADLASLIMRPDQVTREHALQFMKVTVAEFEEMKTTPYRHHRLKSEFKYFYSMFVSNVRIALHLMDRNRSEAGLPADLFVLLRIIDQASHQALEFSELGENHLKSTPEEIARYSQVVSEAYRQADHAVGQLMEAFGGGNVVILSDHGFKLLRARTRYSAYGHSGPSTPDGIFIASGPAIQPGAVAGLGIHDMMPLFLQLKGWPVANDFVSGVPSRVFAEAFLDEHPVETIDSYGAMTVSIPEGGGIAADEEMIERLRALGYLD